MLTLIAVKMKKKIYYFKGLILSVIKRNSLDAGFKIMFRFCGVDCLMFVKLNSPFL